MKIYVKSSIMDIGDGQYRDLDTISQVLDVVETKISSEVRDVISDALAKSNKFDQLLDDYFALVDSFRIAYETVENAIDSVQEIKDSKELPDDLRTDLRMIYADLKTTKEHCEKYLNLLDKYDEYNY